MPVRKATPEDLPAIEALRRAFHREIPAPDHVHVDHDEELREVREVIENGLGFLQETDGEPVAYALAFVKDHMVRLSDLYVAPDARRADVAAELTAAVVDEAIARGATHLDLEVAASNALARSVYRRWGLVEDLVVMSTPIDALRERIAPGRHAVSFASIHVQTDDRTAVERAITAYAPRIGSKGSRFEGPVNGWLVIYDEVCDTDPTALLRYAREMSTRFGAVVIALSLELDEVVRMNVLDRGGIVDEYLSVPEFYGPLPPGDVIGLAANPTVLARLTGADPKVVKEVARTAASPRELPPARELLASIAAMLGLHGAEHGYAEE